MATRGGTNPTTSVTPSRVLKAGELLNQGEGQGLYMTPILHKYHKTLSYLFFDYNNPGRSLKSKFLPIDSTITDDGVSLSWYDYSMFDSETRILSDAANVTVVAVEDTAGYEVGDTVHIARKEGSTLLNEQRNITAVTLDTSITLDSSIDLEVGDKMVRAYYVQEIEQEITRGSSSWKYNEYKSYFQNFARTIKFKKTDLNRTYFLEKSAAEFISSHIAHNMGIMLQEFNKAIYLGKRIPGAKPEML